MHSPGGADDWTADYYYHVEDEPRAPRRLANVELLLGLLLLLTAGAINFVLLKVLYSAYGASSAFFVSQGINVLYCLYGAALVYPRLLPLGIGDAISARMGLECISSAMRETRHQRRYWAMGLLDCMGTFFTAMVSALLLLSSSSP